MSNLRLNQRKTYLELASGPFRYLDVSERVIQKEVQKRGYTRHPARSKPPASSKTMTTRKQWAEAHLHWTVDDWMEILWTDETWAMDGRHSKDWVTRNVSLLYFYDKKLGVLNCESELPGVQC